jgi:hypothetical protein
MDYGITEASFIPVRKEPDSASEMTSQLLFGELFKVLERKGQWILTKNLYDGYEGWISPLMTSLFGEGILREYQTMESSLVRKRQCSLSGPRGTLMVPAGSVLYYHEAGKGRIRCGSDYDLEGDPGKIATDKLHELEQLCGEFMNTPYLWGGKSTYGTDCSGLVQTVFRLLGIPLPRDAFQQVSQGETVNMISEASAGDLVFFDNEEGQIVHTGIISSPGQIFHASGCVRMDIIDHQGIYSRQLEKYSHRLRVIKRIF